MWAAPGEPLRRQPAQPEGGLKAVKDPDSSRNDPECNDPELSRPQHRHPPTFLDFTLQYRPGYRPDVDGIRAIAVLAVVFYHFNEELLPGGFTGVDIFFVVSGYVVSASLRKTLLGSSLHDQGSRESSNYCGFDRLAFLSEFYARRVRRLYPALTAIFWVFTLFFAWFVPYWVAGLVPITQTAFFSLIGGANVLFATQSLDYWAKDAVAVSNLNPFLHTWSLGVEEQFYVIFSLLVVLFGDNKRHGLVNPFGTYTVVLFLLTIGSFVHCWLLQADGRTGLAFYLVSSRFWEMALGALMLQLEVLYVGARTWKNSSSSSNENENDDELSYVATKKSSSLQQLQEKVRTSFVLRLLRLSNISGGMILVSLISSAPGEDFPIPVALLSTFGTCLFIAANWEEQVAKLKLSLKLVPAAKKKRTSTSDGKQEKQNKGGKNQQRQNPGVMDFDFNRVCTNRWMIYIGQISYCMYLLHWPVTVAFHWAQLSTTPTFAIAFPLIWTMTVILYHYWEVPLRGFQFSSGANKKLTKAKERRCVLLAGAASIALGGAWWAFLAEAGGHQALYTGDFSVLFNLPNMENRPPKPFFASSNAFALDLQRSAAATLDSSNATTFFHPACGCIWSGKTAAGDMLPPPSGASSSSLANPNSVGTSGGSVNAFSQLQANNYGYCAHERPISWPLWSWDEILLDNPENNYPWPASTSLDDPEFVPEIVKYYKRPPQTADQEPVVWLFGDSHAARMVLTMKAATGRSVVLAQSGIALMTENDQHSEDAFAALFSALQQQIRSGDFVAVSYMAARMNSDAARTRIGAKVSQLQNIVRGVGGDTKLILFADVPTLPLPGPLCLPMKFGR
eukprot:g20524.t1